MESISGSFETFYGYFPFRGTAFFFCSFYQFGEVQSSKPNYKERGPFNLKLKLLIFFSSLSSSTSSSSRKQLVPTSPDVSCKRFYQRQTDADVQVALFSALLPCLVLARTTLVSGEAKELLEQQDAKEMREKREADSQDNAAVLFNLDPIDNMLSSDEARVAKAASVELDQFEELEKLANVVEGEGEPRLEKSLLNTFPFNQHHDGDHHGDHGSHGDHHGHHGDHGDHGERHGEQGGHHGNSEYSSASLDRSASSAPLRNEQGSAGPLRNRLSNRVKNVVANQVGRLATLLYLKIIQNFFRSYPGNCQ